MKICGRAMLQIRLLIMKVYIDNSKWMEYHTSKLDVDTSFAGEVIRMEITHRQITKIAREVNKFTVRTMKADGIGTAEFDFIHLVRHHPGITQAEVRNELRIDKGAAARRTANLEEKGYLVRKENPNDKRSQLLYATEKAERLKNSKAYLESVFYEWLLGGLSQDDSENFARILKILYEKSKKQSRAGFPDLLALLEGKERV